MVRIHERLPGRNNEDAENEEDHSKGWDDCLKRLRRAVEEEKLVEMSARALSLASPGVPGNCRKQCSVPGRSPWEHHGRTRGTDGNIERACVVLYFRQKHDGRNEFMIYVNHAIL